MDLLLVTATFPHAFLDVEVRYLAEHFNRVIVAPMRPSNLLTSELPNGVVVDHSLSQHLVRNRLTRTRSSRFITAAERAALPNPSGAGFTRRDLLIDGRRREWIRQALLRRADSKSVGQWASSRKPPSIAYTFWLGAATAGLRQAWPTVPLVSRVHGGDLFSEAHGWESIPYQHAALRSCDLVASVSENGRNYLVRKFPDIERKAACRRLGILDLGGIASTSGGPPVRLLSASSIDTNKRVHLIAEVALALAQSGLAVEWTHLGDGPGRSSVEDMAASGLREFTVNIRGHVPLEEVHRELTSGEHDVFVNLSLSEGAPVSLMEAQCVGLPVVATAVGGTPEVVGQRWNELVRPDASVDEIAEAILRANARPAAERQARRQFWSDNYDAETNYTNWARELRALALTERVEG